MIDSPVVLLLVLAVIAAVPLLLRRHKASQPDGLRVVSRTALSKSAVVAVVAVGERRLLVGAAERGIQLLADVTEDEHRAGASDPDGVTTTSMSSDSYSTYSLDRRDAVVAEPETEHDGALDALVGAAPVATPAGPRIGLVDRLRAMTVRTPAQGRPLHVPFRH